MLCETDPLAVYRLRELGGEDLVRRLVALFLENTPGRIRTLVRGEEGEDWKAVERAAHSLRSTAASLGLTTLQDLAARIEDSAEANRRDALRPLLRELEAGFPLVRDRLERLIHP